MPCCKPAGWRSSNTDGQCIKDKSPQKRRTDQAIKQSFIHRLGPIRSSSIIMPSKWQQTLCWMGSDPEEMWWDPFHRYCPSLILTFNTSICGFVLLWPSIVLQCSPPIIIIGPSILSRHNTVVCVHLHRSIIVSGITASCRRRRRSSRLNTVLFVRPLLYRICGCCCSWFGSATSAVPPTTIRSLCAEAAAFPPVGIVSSTVAAALLSPRRMLLCHKKGVKLSIIYMKYNIIQVSVVWTHRKSKNPIAWWPWQVLSKCLNTNNKEHWL